MGRHFAVLGGGLTGLSAAFHLTRHFPSARVTLFEKSPRLGGWVQSERVAIDDGKASVVLEGGPRTLRTLGKSVLELINLLGLDDSVIIVPKTSPAARNRYLHLPEREGILSISATILGILRSPLRSVQLSSVAEVFRRANRPEGVMDESVDSFFTRRFGERFARIFGSAICHGIYAADSRQLSARATFPNIWKAEENGNGSLILGLVRPNLKREPKKDDYEMGAVSKLMRNASVYSFKNGMESLAYALARNLASKSNVDILLNTAVSSLRLTDGDIQLTTSKKRTLRPSHVVSTLPLSVLDHILPQDQSLPHLLANPYASVTVYSYVFRAAQKDLHPAGFGYLIPRAASPTPIDNTPQILGTVFDSCALSSQDSHPSQYTKLTVMVRSPPNQPDTDPAEVLAHIAAHLRPADPSSFPLPVHVRVRRQERCIPTPTPGHVERMEELRKVLKEGPWKGRLGVIGAGVDGVSVPNCVEAGKRVGQDW